MVAGAGALVYWIWKKVLTEEQKCKLSGGELVTNYCIEAPCPKSCIKN